MEIVVFIFEIIGTVAFAISGALVAIDKKMDMLGIVTLGLITSIGGGITRDIILNKMPPQAFVQPVYTLVAISVSLIMFIPQVRKYLHERQLMFERLLLIMDSLGLGIFTVIGLSVARQTSDNTYLILVVGILTGVGGGVLRDILSNNTPFIFIKHFYASAAIIGAVVTVILWQFFSESIAMPAGMITVVVLRLLAARFRWDLPHA